MPRSRRPSLEGIVRLCLAASVGLSFIPPGVSADDSRELSAPAVDPGPRHDPGPLSTQLTGTLYKRLLYLERVRFRRDGDKVGKGELHVSARVWPRDLQDQYEVETSLGGYKLQHSKKPKKCADLGCESSLDGDCRWLELHELIFDDIAIENSFCNPVEAHLDFTDRDGKKYKAIGDIDTDGGVNDYLTSPAPLPVGSGDATLCAERQILHTLGDDKPARAAFKWVVRTADYKAVTVGHPVCSTDDSTECTGVLSRFQIGQVSGTELWFKVSTKTLVLNDGSITGTRLIYVPLDTDVNPLTGDDTETMCGADYRVVVELVYAGGAPTRNLTLEWFNSFGTWQVVPGEVLDFHLNKTSFDFKLLLLDIGAPTVGVTSWVVFNQNGFEVGILPCSPCFERPTVEIESDSECPLVVRVDASELHSGSASGALKVRFSEPMAPITVADIDLSPVPPGVVTTAMSDANRVLSITVAPQWSAGEYVVTLLPTITDFYGHALAADSDPSACGAAVPLEVCVDDVNLVVTDAAGYRVNSLPNGAAVHVHGSELPTPSPFEIYLVQADGLDRWGAPLVDFTEDGPNTVVADVLGNLASTNLGVAVAPDEYGVVADVNDNGILDPGDRISGRCEPSLYVGPDCLPDPPGPAIALWSFDQKTDLAAGERVSGLHGAVTAPAAWVEGKVRGALEFDGASTKITVPNSPDLWVDDHDFSIVVWIRDALSNGTIVSHEEGSGKGYALSLSGGLPVFAMNDGSGTTSFTATGSPNLTGSGWRLLAVTVDRASPTGLRMYVDASLVHTGDPRARAGLIQPLGSLLVGARFQPGPLFAGQMDELAIFDEALSPADLTQLRDSCSGSFLSAEDGPTPPRVGLAAPRLRPNPASGMTTIEYAIPAAGLVDVSAFDLAGRQVRRLSHRMTAAGEHRIAWRLDDGEGRRLPAGIYIVAIRWNGIGAARSMVVVK